MEKETKKNESIKTTIELNNEYQQIKVEIIKNEDKYFTLKVENNFANTGEIPKTFIAKIKGRTKNIIGGNKD